MDKNAIKKYAVWARRELIARVSQKALQYGIEKDNIVDVVADSVNTTVLSVTEKKQRQALIAQINDKGFEQVMEEVAYTWFNRFSALRFMEVNSYLPSHVRVFTDEENNFKPQIITEAIHLEMDGLDMEKVYAFKEADKTEDLYKYLLITQCNALNSILPGMFQKISDYTELLLPDNLLREGSVIEQMIIQIPEDDWKDAVQIIGWLYQYYNTEKKDDVFAALKKNVKITKENIPAATQLFTPDWIVRYMVENSLGRLWLEGHPNVELKSEWKYYLDEAEQESDVQVKLAEIRKEYAALTPDQLKVIDPCCGSGHILAYMFDVLVQIYEAYGFTTREAVASIVENNIYGLDIDDRAAQMADFAIMMKARQYDRRFFSRGLLPHVYAIKESNGVKIFAPERLGDEGKIAEKLIHGLHDAKEYGSILNLDITMDELSQLRSRLEEIDEMSSMGNLITMMESGEIIEVITPLIDVAEAMVQKYDVVVTNPPYMGSNNMGTTLSRFVKENYPNSKSDMSTVCMEMCHKHCKSHGMYAMINIPVWMTQSSFTSLRREILLTSTFVNMLHLGRGVFGSDFGTTSFVIRNGLMKDYLATYRRLFEGVTQVDMLEVKEKWFFEKKGVFVAKQHLFEKIDGLPIAYWVTKGQVSAFSSPALSTLAEPRQGFATGDNERFLRLWQEVDITRVGFDCRNRDEAGKSDYRWFPCNKGGAFRRWYGNNERLVNWENDGREMTGFAGSVIRNPLYYFRQGMTWSTATMSKLSMRYSPAGFLFESKGSVCFPVDEKNLNYLLALLNTKIVEKLLLVLAPTVDYHEGPLGRIPVIVSQENFEIVSNISKDCIGIAKTDWDSFETSWDFRHHPLMPSSGSKIYRSWNHDGKVYLDEKPENIPWSHLLESAYQEWETQCEVRFNQLKANEEELNRIFIDIYGLQDELTPEVEDKDVTVRRADLQRDIKSLISYAVGCMFGRYSLDVDGLAYAGGEWDASEYTSFSADKDNIIPICDDEYFDDDIVGRFVKFIEVVYGKETLEDNLKFIADALCGKGQPRDVIRNYFLNDFYSDHCKMYQKRPIYWLFDSGKKNGFKALIYMHRYQPDTIARVRTDYVHEQQARYRTAIEGLEQRIAVAATGERVKLNKQLATLQVQETEIREYEERVHHLADQMISINLDDGVKKNYEIFKDVLAKIK